MKSTVNYFDADTIRSVVEHMNEDHQDACLCIAKAFSPYPSAQSALLISFDSEGLDMTVTEAKKPSHPVRIAFDKPLARDNQIRGTLVAMTKRARALLSK